MATPPRLDENQSMLATIQSVFDPFLSRRLENGETLRANTIK